MAYTDFTLADLEVKFGLTTQIKPLFPATQPIAPSENLERALQRAEKLRLRTEKAKSEWVVVPVLNELLDRNGDFFTVYSGESLNADSEKGLNGDGWPAPADRLPCDFLLAKETGSIDISFPIIQIVEAKKNDTDIGIPQCAAQLIGATFFNNRKGVVLQKLFGCVTPGREWVFMCLEDSVLTLDTRTYYLIEIAEVIAVFQHIMDYYKRVLP